MILPSERVMKYQESESLSLGNHALIEMADVQKSRQVVGRGILGEKILAVILATEVARSRKFVSW